MSGEGSGKVFCMWQLYFTLQLQECIYLQVDLLGVGGLGGQGAVACLLEREGEDGGDPHVSRGAHLAQVLIKIIKVGQNRER